ncbi:MAG: hypothetical protein K9H25_05510 [Rhodospirillum sp.]|nr:hypothetical protein [Rhodospirillum sp.]MCF8488946.1 hypothetical protein [Rhodospirillum sp.]MCF8499002.1 hypothetical protein [Rhodospirillum sp.]
MIKFPFAKTAAVVLVLCGTAQSAEAETWTFKDWNISTTKNPTTGKMDCLAVTSADVENQVRLTYEQGSEFSYPTITFRHLEVLPRHEPLLWQDAKLTFIFDDSSEFSGTTEDISPLMINGEGRTAFDGYPYNNELAMTSMAQGDRMSAILTDDGTKIFDVSLSGFVASYLKIVEQCGAERDGIF